MSGHEIIYITYDINFFECMYKTVHYCDFKNLNSDFLANTLREHKSLTPVNLTNLDDSLTVFNNSIQWADDECLPVKTLLFKNRVASWITW